MGGEFGRVLVLGQGRLPGVEKCLFSCSGRGCRLDAGGGVE